jgi:VWFA-related protein
MKRRLAALLACGWMAFGQRNGPAAPSSAALNPLVTDVVAVDAAGRPVTDLAAEDFEVVQDGRAVKITNFTWFDTRLHAAVSRSGQAQQPALDLLPDEIRRNFVVVVDDLGLSPAGINGVRQALADFLSGSMSSGDRMAILRSSGGSAARQQLTGDARKLNEAIGDIRYLGGSTSPAVAGSAYWVTLRWALDGLRDFAGRKAVVLFSENPGVPGPWDRVAAEAAHAAHAAAATVYAVHPLPEAAGAAALPTGALESLARDTGGMFCRDFARVLENEQGYYAIGFRPEANPDDPAGASTRPSPAKPAVLKVRRAGVVVRARAGFLSQRPRVEFPVPVNYAELLSKGLASPFAGEDTRANLTALFSETSRTGPVVEAVLHFDARNFTFIHDLQDVYHGAVRMRMAAYRDDGLSTVPMEETSKVILRPAEYRFAMEHGLRLMFQVKLPDAGGWQIRALAADGSSDRVGTAARFVEVPDLRKGGLALSGLAMGVSAPAAGGAAPDPDGDSDVRIFRPGSVCTFQYSIFNAPLGADKKSALEMHTRMFAGGRVVFEGKPERMTFGELPAGARRQITGRLNLDPKMAPGDYVLQVTVRDLAGEAHTATQFTDFQVRE